MTPKEIADIRLKCAELYIVTGSKVGLIDGTILGQAERLYQFVMKPLNDANIGQAKAPTKK